MHLLTLDVAETPELKGVSTDFWPYSIYVNVVIFVACVVDIGKL